MARDTLRSPAWLLIGLTRSRPGALLLSHDRLRFETDEECLFDVPLSDVLEITFPWYYFSGGMKLVIRGERYRLSFMEPGERGDIVEGRRVGKAWRAALSGEEK